MNTSKIEWTDRTWNPIRGCTRVSPGCRNCYAAAYANPRKGIPGHAYELGFTPRVVPERLSDPLRMTKPKTIFVNSMSDLFHEDFALDDIARVVRVMGRANWHTFQVLTKRADRLHELLTGPLVEAAGLDHVWWGVSVENRRHGLPRIDRLRQTPARVKFLSVEPLLEDLGPIDLSGIHWVILGGESGPNARPFDPAWARSVRDQCAAARVPFFFKQWGGRNKKAAGRLLDGQTHDDMPAVSRHPVARLAQRRQ
jgi:protein gp37